MALSITFPSVQVNTNSSYSPVEQYYSDGETCYRYKIFSGEEIRENPDLLNALTYKEVTFTESFLREFGNDVHWCAMCEEQKIDIDFIREHKDTIDFWNWVSEHVLLTPKLIEEFQNYLNWRIISGRKDLTEEFVRKHIDKIVLFEVYSNENLSEQFFRDYHSKINWANAIVARKFSEEFLLEFRKEIEAEEMWYCLSLYQNVSIEFIEKYNLNPSFKDFFYGRDGTIEKYKYDVWVRHIDRKVIE